MRNRTILTKHFATFNQKYLGYIEANFRLALTQLLGEMLADWSEPIDEQDRETMLRNARISRTISIVCSTLTYFMLFAFVSLQIWSNAENASEADLGGLLHPATFPYETSKSPNYEITWLGQLTGTVLTAICYSCFDTFLAVLVLHLCGQLTVLGTALEDLVNATSRNDYKTFEERLGSIVNRHNHLSRFANIVQYCLQAGNCYFKIKSN